MERAFPEEFIKFELPQNSNTTQNNQSKKVIYVINQSFDEMFRLAIILAIVAIVGIVAIVATVKK
jgi:hypothetical protein